MPMTLQPPGGGGGDPDALFSGVTTLPRSQGITNAVPNTSQLLRITYFTAQRSLTTTQVRTFTGGTAAATVTLCRIGLYAVNTADGALTSLLANTTNDATLWTAANTLYTKSWASSFALVAGTRYALGTLCVATTPPTMAGNQPNPGVLATSAAQPMLCAQFASQSDLPSTVAAGSLANATNRIYAELV